MAQSLLGKVKKKSSMALEGEGRLPRGIRRKWSFVHLDFGSIPYGYGWIFPKDNLVSMGFCALFPSKGMKLRSRFERFIGSVDYIRGVRMERVCLSPLPNFSGDNLPVSGERVVLVGDAANLMDPMTGEGIYYAVRSGKMAGEAIVKAILEDQKGIVGYQEALKSNFFQDLTVTLKLAKAVYLFPRVAYSILKSNKDLGLLYRDLLVGNARYSAFSREMADRIRRHLESRITAMIKMSTAPG